MEAILRASVTQAPAEYFPAFQKSMKQRHASISMEAAMWAFVT